MQPAHAPHHSTDRVRLMIADDSVVVRGLLQRWLSSDPGIEIVAVAGDGRQAVDMAAKHLPDVIVLDIEMPRMSGLEALPHLMALTPKPKVVMSSTLTTRGADVTMRALDLGAADYLAKPQATHLGGADAFRNELIAKVLHLGRAAQIRRSCAATAHPAAPAQAPAPKEAAEPYRPIAPRRVDVVAVAASTGGPPALKAFIEALGPDFRTPVLIVQHMPATFTPILADHLGRQAGREAREAVDGEPITPGAVLIAPGGKHLTVKRSGARMIAHLDEDPPENWCRPAADKLFRSVAEAYGANALAVVLTGMGHDGLAGARAMAERGAPILAQDEASSVVWGMPGAIADAKLASLVAPVQSIAADVRRLCGSFR